MQVHFDTDKLEDYELFLKVKSLPVYRIVGHTAEFPDEYAGRLGVKVRKPKAAKYEPLPGLFDYQRAIVDLAIRKRKFAIFAEPGLGKTLMIAEWVRYVSSILSPHKRILWFCPLMVVQQTIDEIRRFYGDDFIVEKVESKNAQQWIDNATGCRAGITNWDALKKPLTKGNLGALAGDETQIMKSAYGTIGRGFIRLGRGLDWKLCSTGTPAPNDRIEYGSHAVFLDRFPNINSFLAKYFVNRGQTEARWELKPHALRPFYRDLSHWCIFLNNPATYGWKDNSTTIPPIHVHIDDVPMTAAQRDAVYDLTGMLVPTKSGGVTQRTKMSRIGKGTYKGKAIATLKYDFIRDKLASWPDESTLVWCWFDDEQK